MAGIEILAKAVRISISCKIKGRNLQSQEIFLAYFSFPHLAFLLCLTISCIFSGKSKESRKKEWRGDNMKYEYYENKFTLSWNDKKMPKLLKSINHASTEIQTVGKEFQTAPLHRGSSTPDVNHCRACTIIVQSTVIENKVYSPTI